MSKTVHQLLINKYPPNECVVIKEVADSSRRNRYLDFMVINLWESRGQSIIGFEVKSYRSDWIKEMKSPDKQELHAPFCDYFYLLITDEKVAKLEELPPNWGLMVVRGDKLFTLKKAPKQNPKPMPKSLWVSIVRRSADKSDYILQSDVMEHIKAKAEAMSESYKKQSERTNDKLEQLNKSCREFRELTGIDVSGGGYNYRFANIKKISEKMNFLVLNDIDSFLERLVRIQELSKKILSDTQYGLELFKTEKEPEKNETESNA